jgi:hypothetical protein
MPFMSVDPHGCRATLEFAFGLQPIVKRIAYAPSICDRVLFCDELLTLSSFSRDPLADVCWAILELDVVGFAAP